MGKWCPFSWFKKKADEAPPETPPSTAPPGAPPAEVKPDPDPAGPHAPAGDVADKDPQKGED